MYLTEKKTLDWEKNAKIMLRLRALVSDSDLAWRCGWEHQTRGLFGVPPNPPRRATLFPPQVWRPF
jgi:hypothetical protein